MDPFGRQNQTCLMAIISVVFCWVESPSVIGGSWPRHRSTRRSAKASDTRRPVSSMTGMPCGWGSWALRPPGRPLLRLSSQGSSLRLRGILPPNSYPLESDGANIANGRRARKAELSGNLRGCFPKSRIRETEGGIMLKVLVRRLRARERCLSGPRLRGILQPICPQGMIQG